MTDDGVVLEPVTGQESHMIVRAAGANALLFAPRGEGTLAAGARGALPAARLSLYADVVRRRAPWLDAHESRVGDVAMRGEETRMTGLELDDLVSGRAQDGKVCGLDDAVTCD